MVHSCKILIVLFQPLCGMYNEIAKAYASFEVAKVSVAIDKYAEPLSRVSNNDRPHKALY